MTDWYERAFKALQLAGYAEKSQQCYLRGIRMLVEHTGKTPDLVTEEELQDYFLHRSNVNRWAPGTMRICYSGLKFFFTRVLRREWGCKPEPPKILPENTVGAVSGLLYNPTLFSAHILPGFDRYYQPMVTCDGKQVFGVNPHQCRLCAHAGNFWGSGVQPLFGIFAALAEFERELISERTKAGLASARARGRSGGAPYKMTAAKLRLAMAAMGQQETKVGVLCNELGITRQTLYRHVDPEGNLRDDGKKLLANRANLNSNTK